MTPNEPRLAENILRSKKCPVCQGTGSYEPAPQPSVEIKSKVRWPW